jgi:ubiquinone/menaquinone biosynthesis C-methylase UbiE
MRTKEKVIETYKKGAESYDKERFMDFEGEYLDRKQKEFIKKIIGKVTGKKILECGCGTGRIAIELAKAGADVHGIDTSEEMLNKTKIKAEGLGLSISLKKGDIESIPYASETFDVVYTMHVLMHLPNYHKAIDEMYRVLAPGGILIADFPNKLSPGYAISVAVNPKIERTHLFSKSVLENELRDYTPLIKGWFSYPRTLFKVPIFGRIFPFLERVLPFPISLRRQLIILIRKAPHKS